jgi:uncharacterized membrane protein YraQ (UPF0718 family)
VFLKNWLYGLYALILGLLAWQTGEIVTFVMLGFILMSLQNIYVILQKIYQTLKEKQTGEYRQE